MAIDYKALIQIVARDDTGAAFGKVQSSLTKSGNLANSMALGLTALVTATAAAVTTAYVVFDQLISKGAEFQDMAEKVGDSAANLASLAVAAQITNTAMDSLVSMSNKLTKNLVGVDDESSAAGAAVKALGLNLEDLKTQLSTDRFITIAKALDQFADGTSKVAVLQALMGKSAGEALPFMNELARGVGQVFILNSQQIKQMDDYKDRQAKLRAELSLYAITLAADVLPQVSAFTAALGDTAKAITGVNDEAAKLQRSRDLQNWVDLGLGSLSVLGDAVFVLAQSIRILATTTITAFQQMKAASQGKWGDVAKFGDIWLEDARKMKFSLGLFKNYMDERAKLLADQPGAPGTGKRLAGWEDPRTAHIPVPEIRDQNKPELKYTGPVTAAAGAAAAAGSAMLKAQLANDLQAIKAQADALVNNYSNAEKIVEAMRSAGLVDDQAYYASKLAFLRLNAAAQDALLDKDIKQMQAQKFTGAAKIENETKIAEAQAKRGKIAADLAAAETVLSIQATENLTKVAKAYLEAEAAAQDYLDTLRRGQALELQGIGVGNDERQRITGRAQIEDKYASQRQQLDLQKRQAELALQPGESISAEAQKIYDEEVDRIRRFKATALTEYDDYYAKLKKLQGDWQKGAAEAVANYESEARNTFKLTENLFVDAFQNMEDALVSFVTTGKLDFKSLADSIIADITRIIIKQQIMLPLMNMMGLSSTGAGTGAGIFSSFLGNLFGTPAAAASTSSSLYSLGTGTTMGFTLPGRAIGGPVAAGKIYQVNEQGPELLTIAGRQYLMMGKQSGAVTPNEAWQTKAATAESSTVVNHHVVVQVTAPEGTSRSSAMQWGAAAGRQVQRAMARNS